jgi:hypothetical protein
MRALTLASPANRAGLISSSYRYDVCFAMAVMGQRRVNWRLLDELGYRLEEICHSGVNILLMDTDEPDNLGMH